ncbi:hypothetical protein RJT34_12775 [Clitoria ternatea]|uniref:Uncharacterized protein n=1 Tax=Clitoria ternatea TaxID=43366 RepID=A0AAN9JMV1_CLITE
MKNIFTGNSTHNPNHNPLTQTQTQIPNTKLETFSFYSLYGVAPHFGVSICNFVVVDLGQSQAITFNLLFLYPSEEDL